MKGKRTMKSILPTLSLLLVLCGLPTLARAAEPVSQQHALPGVRRVVIETPGELRVHPGKEARLTIEAEPDVLRALDVSIRGNTLFLRSKENFKTQRGLVYVVTLPRLDALTSQGGGDVTVGAFQGEELAIELAGSGNIALAGVKTGRLDLKVSGSGNIDARGSGDALYAEISGAGEIRAENCAVRHAQAKIGGSGEIRLTARERLAATIDGAGNIRYGGAPTVTQSISGAGSVDPL
jgi:hypothetical protein